MSEPAALQSSWAREAREASSTYTKSANYSESGRKITSKKQQTRTEAGHACSRVLHSQLHSACRVHPFGHETRYLISYMYQSPTLHHIGPRR